MRVVLDVPLPTEAVFFVGQIYGCVQSKEGERVEKITISHGPMIMHIKDN